jgi:tyrosyl-tRNA synthetase
VRTYHSPATAQATLDEWNTRFSEKRLSDAQLPQFVSADEDIVTAVVNAFSLFGVTKSRAEVSRLIKQGSVQIDGNKIVDPKARLALRSGQVLRLDKTHAVRIT